MTLYQMTVEYLSLLALAKDPETDPEDLADTLEALTDDIGDKAEGYACVIKELQAEQEKFKAESKRLADHADTIGNNIQRMKDHLLQNMRAMGIGKIQTEHFKVSEVKNGGKLPIRYTGDVPEEYQIMEPKTDTAKIREALEAGEVLEFAELAERGTHLSIR